MKKVNIVFISLIFLLMFISLNSAEKSYFDASRFLKGGKIVSPPGTYKGGNIYASKDFLKIIVDFGKFLKENSRLMIRINGYTDNEGKERINHRISLKRAQLIKDFLVKKLNVYKDRILTEGLAASSPIADNGSEDGRRRNRRVEIMMQKKPNSAGIITFILRDVFTKAPQDISFQRAKLHEPLFNLFRLNTGDSSDANITLRDKSRLNIGPNSLMIIYDYLRSDKFDSKKGKNREVRLLTGFLRTKLNDIRNKFRVKTPACEINSGSRVILVDISKDKKSAVSVFDGKSEVIAREKSISVPEGYGTFVKKGEEPAQPEPLPKSPKIISPENIEFFISEESNKKEANIVFKWNSTENINHIQVASDRDFEKILLNRKVDEKTLTRSFKAGKYFWRVAGINSSGIEGYTAVSTFKVKPKKSNIPLDITPTVFYSPGKAHDAADVVKRPFINIEGKTLAGSSIVVDGINVKISKNGSFSHKINLHRGWNLLNLVVNHTGYITKNGWISICYYPGLKHSGLFKNKKN